METIKAIIETINPDGPHGPYAIATSDKLEGSVTISLTPKVWKEGTWPKPGTVVLLGKLIQKRQGWRAEYGRIFRLSDQQGANSMCIKRQTSAVEIQERLFYLLESFLNKEDELAWNNWVAYKERGEEDILKLLSSNVREGIKQIALFVLFLPHRKFKLMRWKGTIPIHPDPLDFLMQLPPSLLNFAVSLITEFYGSIQEIYDVNGASTMAMHSEGFTASMRSPAEFEDSMRYYNTCILYLLKNLNPDGQEKVFPYYQILDPYIFWHWEECSGYNAFNKLMQSKVDEKWKVEADKKMREIILAEISGTAKPREEWERAFNWYCHELDGQRVHKTYSEDLFADQLGFVASVNGMPDKFNTLRLITSPVLAKQNHAETRQKLALKWLAVQEKRVAKNKHWFPDDQKNLTWVADTFKNVPQITALAQNILQKGVKRLRAEEKSAQREQNNKQHEQEEEARILQSMM